MPEPFRGLRNVKMAGYTVVDRLVTGRLVDKVVAVSSDIEKVLAPDLWLESGGLYSQWD
jgi:hypothetical protein